MPIPEFSQPSVVRTMPPGSEVRWSHCPVGWIRCLDSVTELLDLHAPGWTLQQVKSKFASLAFYWDAPDIAPEQRTKLQAVVTAITGRATYSCEVCGSSPARSHNLQGWVTLLCTTHADLSDPESVPLISLRTSTIDDPISDGIVRRAERTNLAATAAFTDHSAPSEAPPTPVDLARLAELVTDAPEPAVVIDTYGRLDIAFTCTGWPRTHYELQRAGWPEELALIWSTTPNPHLDQRTPVDVLRLLGDDTTRDAQLLLSAKLNEALRSPHE